MRPLIFLISFAALSLSAFATIRTVSVNPGSGQYTDIQAAQNASSSGDTIVVGPGTYSIVTTNRRVHIIGAGWDQTIISAGGAIGFSVTSGSAGTTIEGFRVNGSNWAIYCYSGTDSITIRRCLTNTSSSQIGITTGRLSIEDCVLHAQSNSDIIGIAGAGTSGNIICRNVVFSNGTAAGFTNSFDGNHGGVIEIYNCVFLNAYNPFLLSGLPQVIGLNNIFWDWAAATGYGTLPVGSVFEYTAAGGGQPAFPAGFSNNITLGANNPFVNYNNTNNYEIGISDLHLNGGAGGLACTDTGYPSIDDLDATRSDLGVYGGPKPLVDNGIPAYPFALTLSIDNLVEVGDSVSVTSTGRIGPRY